MYKIGHPSTSIIVTNLTPGVTYIFQVKAKNEIGFSPYSNLISIMAVQASDAPNSLAEDTALRSPTTLGVKWTAPTFNGGAEVTDYHIDIAKLGEEFTANSIIVANTNYKAESLSAGVSYKFRIKSKNSFGYSVYSELVLLCAFKPEVPLAPTSVLNNDKVTISWIEPNN